MFLLFLLDRSFLRFPTTSYEPIIVAVDVAIAKIVGSNANVREKRKYIRDKFSIFLARFVREQSGWFCGSFLHNDLHASPPILLLSTARSSSRDYLRIRAIKTNE